MSKNKLLLMSAIAVIASSAASALEDGRNLYLAVGAGYAWNDTNFTPTTVTIFRNKSSTAVEDYNGQPYYGLGGPIKRKNSLGGIAASIGFGYFVTEQVRTEMTIMYSNPSKKLRSVETPTSFEAYSFKPSQAGQKSIDPDTDKNRKASLMGDLRVKEPGVSLLVGAAYDFVNSSAFTPYLMLKLGVRGGRTELGLYPPKKSDSNSGSSVFKLKSKKKIGFEYQGGVGAYIAISKEVRIGATFIASGQTGDYKFKKEDLAALSTLHGGDATNALLPAQYSELAFGDDDSSKGFDKMNKTKPRYFIMLNLEYRM